MREESDLATGNGVQLVGQAAKRSGSLALGSGVHGQAKVLPVKIALMVWGAILGACDKPIIITSESRIMHDRHTFSISALPKPPVYPRLAGTPVGKTV
jgi:hypothetical protein